MKFFLISFAFLASVVVDVQSDAAFKEIGTYVKDGITKKFYYPRYFQTSHTHARSVCQSYGMDFAMIESTNEYDSVYNMLLENGNQDFAIIVDGITLTPKSPSDWFFSSTNEKIPYAMTWSPGQPDDDRNNEKCLSLIRNPMYQFNDVPCNIDYPFLCQKKISV